MRKSIVVVSGVTLALLAGCGSEKVGGGTPGAPSGGGDPCRVLTDDQVAKAYGTKPKEHAVSKLGTNGCKWTFEDSLTSLTVYSGPKSDFEARVGEQDHESVSGVGDRAGWAKDAGVLFVVGGSYGLQIIIGIGGTNLGSAEHKDREKQAAVSIARNALAALGVGKGDDATVPAEKTTETTVTLKPGKTTETTEPKTTEPSDTTDTTETTEPEETE